VGARGGDSTTSDPASREGGGGTCAPHGPAPTPPTPTDDGLPGSAAIDPDEGSPATLRSRAGSAGSRGVASLDPA